MDALIAIKGDDIHIVRKDETGAVVASTNGATVELGINPATGLPQTGVPGYVSELASLLTGKVSTDPRTPMPEQTGDNTPKRTLRPGDTIPWPSADVRQETFLVDQPYGVATYPLGPITADMVGQGWIKARAAVGDDFAVDYALTEQPDVNPATMLQNRGGALGLPLHVGNDELDGMSNLRVGQQFYLHVNNLTGTQMAFQVARPA